MRRAPLPAVDWTDAPTGRFKWTRPFRTKDELWFLRVCHHISNAVYCSQLGRNIVNKVWRALTHLNNDRSSVWKFLSSDFKYSKAAIDIIFVWLRWRPFVSFLTTILKWELVQMTLCHGTNRCTWEPSLLASGHETEISEGEIFPVTVVAVIRVTWDEVSSSLPCFFFFYKNGMGVFISRGRG